MEDKQNIIEPLFEKAEKYGKTSIELYKLLAINNFARVVAAIISRGIALLVFSFFIVFINIAISLWLGDILGKNYYGFLCVAAFYGALYLIVSLITNPWLKNKLENNIILKCLPQIK